MPRSILIPTAGANQEDHAGYQNVYLFSSRFQCQWREVFPALAHNYDPFPLLNIRLYSHVGALIESAQVIRRRMFFCNSRQFFWVKPCQALCAIDCKSQRRSLPQQWPDKRWNETTDAILGQYEIEISQLQCNKVTEVEWWSHKVELLQGKVLSGKLVRPLANAGTKTKVARWRAITAEIPISSH